MKNIVWGTVNGLKYAAAYCCIAIGIFAVNPGAFEAQDASFSRVLLLYVLTGIVGGGIVGSMRPLLAEKRTAYVPAIVAATICFFGLLVMLEGPPQTWEPNYWGMLPVGGILFGVGGVHSFWSKHDDL